MRLRLDVPLLRGDFCGRLLEAYGKRTRITYRDIVGFRVFYERIHPFLDGNGRTGRMIMFRECLRGGLVPFIVLDADIILVSAAIRMFRHDRRGCFSEFLQAYGRTKFGEFSSCILLSLLLRLLEK